MVNIGVIGCGYWGPNLIRNFNKVEGCNVTWCADFEDDRLANMKELYLDIKTTKNYDEIINDKDIDAIAIATPVSKHFEQAKKALQNNKHVLIQ